MKTTTWVLGIACLMSPLPAFAWSHFGHMEVAALAWESLEPAVKQRALQLIGLNPYYDRWIGGVPESERDEIAFVRAATFADEIKDDDSGYINDGNEPPDDATASQNIGYDEIQHRYWHYKDLPFSPDGTKTKPPPRVNAQMMIYAFREALPGDVTEEVKSFDLVWLMHLVGDVHQPLHATSRFTKSLRDGDAGGNLITVCDTSGRCGTLHSFWDGAIGSTPSFQVTTEDARRAIEASHSLPEADAQKAAISDEEYWLEESLEVAKTTVYVWPVRTRKGPYNLNSWYEDNAKRVARERASLAAARLANLLNAALK